MCNQLLILWSHACLNSNVSWTPIKLQEYSIRHIILPSANYYTAITFDLDLWPYLKDHGTRRPVVPQTHMNYLEWIKSCRQEFTDGDYTVMHPPFDEHKINTMHFTDFMSNNISGWTYDLTVICSSFSNYKLWMLVLFVNSVLEWFSRVYITDCADPFSVPQPRSEPDVSPTAALWFR